MAQMTKLSLPRLAALIAGVLGFATIVSAADHPFDATTRGVSCKATQQGAMECLYKVGRDLEFSISAVGESDAGISFTRSSYSGDYFASFGVLHGCVIVKYGQSGLKELNEAKSPFAYAFVSPHNGRVYREWRECQAAK
jgi:hypothetical protein